METTNLKKVSYMWSELVTDNKPQTPCTYFDPGTVKVFNPKLMTGLADEGCILLV